MTVFEILDEYVYAKKIDIDMGKPVVVEVRDTDTFERLVVKAHIVPPDKELENANELVLRNLAENIAEEGWKIRVIEELDPEKVNIEPESTFRKDANPNA